MGRGGGLLPRGDERTLTERDPRKEPCGHLGQCLLSWVGVRWGGAGGGGGGVSEVQLGHCSVSLTSHLPPSFMPGEPLASWGGSGYVGAALRRVGHEEYPGYPSIHKAILLHAPSPPRPSPGLS